MRGLICLINFNENFILMEWQMLKDNTYAIFSITSNNVCGSKGFTK